MEEREVMDLAVQAGSILLESGAEIFRVEETIKRILQSCGVMASDAFVLTNGFFTTARLNTRELYARVKYIPLSGTRLDRIAAVNQLSRSLAEGAITPEAAKDELERIRTLPGKPRWLLTAASGVSAAAFCYMFGGSLVDSAAAFLAGLALYAFVLLAQPRLSKMTLNLSGGALVTLLCLLMRAAGWGESINQMVIGSIIPLVPGVSFTNAIRDVAEGNYLSGWVRMLDALLVGFCIAMGVAAVFTLWRRLGGGML